MYIYMYINILTNAFVSKHFFIWCSRTASDTVEGANIGEAPAASVGRSAPDLVLGRSRTTSGATGGMTPWAPEKTLGDDRMTRE